jgi:hypothetical protein
MPPTADDLDLLTHFTVAVYPFAHDLTPGNRAARLKELGGRWTPWWARLDDAAAAGALEAAGFFLPYISGLLYPEIASLRGGGPPGERFGDWVRRLRGRCGRGLADCCRRLPDDAVLRLTARPELYRPLAEFTLVDRRDEIAANLDWIDVVLFPSGIAFLLLKLRLASERPTLGRLIALNAAVRLVHPPTLAWKLPALRLADGAEDFRVRDLMAHLTDGLTAPGGRDEEEIPYTDTEAGRAYGGTLELLSFACVGLGNAGRAALPAGAFASGEDRILYEFAACIGLGETVTNPMWAPAPEQAARVMRDNRLAMWRCWKAMALKQTCVFLAGEDLPFTRHSLPRAVEANYLPLYLYVLYQKFQLFAFSGDLMHEAARGKVSGARALLRRFVSFRNRYWFSEVTLKPIGGELYRTLQQGLEVPALYQLVTGSVKDAKEYYEGIWQRQVQWLKDALTYGGPLLVTLGAARMLLGGTEVGWAAAAAAGVLAAAFVWLRARGARRAPRRPRLRGLRRFALPGLFRERRRSLQATEDTENTEKRN